MNTNDKNGNVKFAVMAKEISYLVKKIDKIEHKLDMNYVTQAEFEPIKRIVYGLVTLILVGVVGALLSLVVIR